MTSATPTKKPDSKLLILMCENTQEADRTLISHRIVAVPASTLSALLEMQPCTDAGMKTGCSKQAVGFNVVGKVSPQTA